MAGALPGRLANRAIAADVGPRRRSLCHRSRLRRRACCARRVGLWRARDDRGGTPGRRHLRYPRLRAEETAGLRLAIFRRLRGRCRLRLDCAGTHIPLADVDRQCRPRGGAVGSRLYEHARTFQRRAGQEPCRAGRRPHRAPSKRGARPRRDDPDLDRRLAALRAENSRLGTRDVLERGVSAEATGQGVSSSRAAAISQWNSPVYSLD